MRQRRSGHGVWAVVLGGCLAAACVLACETVAGVREVRLADDAVSEAGETGDAPDGDTGDSKPGPVPDTETGETGETGPACPTDIKGPAMVRVTTSTAVFCIDPVETTGPEYRAFIESPTKPAAPSRCGGFTAAEPTGGYTAPTIPQGRVSYCAAAQYCAWAGKRLCTRPEWEFTCSQGDKTVYPYGNTHTPGACVDGAASAGPVGTSTCCGSAPPFSDVYDLSGNIDEWVEDCDDGKGECNVMGGYYGDVSTAIYLQCKAPLARLRAFDEEVGVRCCADPL